MDAGQVYYKTLQLRNAGAPPEVVDRYVKARGFTPADMQTEAAKTSPGRVAQGLGSMALGALEGPTFGWSRELMEAAGLEGMAEASRRAEARDPGAFQTGDILGSIAAPVGLLGATAKAATRAPEFARTAIQGAANISPLRALGTTMGIGAGVGALEGAGRAAPGMGNRAMGAATGGALGGLLGGAVAVPGMARRIMRGRAAPEEKAQDAIAGLISESRQPLPYDQVQPPDTPASLMAPIRGTVAAEAGRGTSIPLGYAGGEALSDITSGLAHVPGPARQYVRGQLRNFQEDAAGRIGEQIRAALAVPSGQFQKSMSALAKARQGIARMQYGSAYGEAPIALDRTTMANLKGREDFERAFREARRTAKMRGEPITSTDLEVEPLSIQDWDYVERELRDQVTRAYKSGRSSRASAMRQNLDDLRAALDAASPRLKAARENYASQKALEEALQMGRDFAKSGTARSADDFRLLVDDMKPIEREMLKVGAGTEIVDAVRRTSGGGNPLGKIFGNEDRAERIATIFADEPGVVEALDTLTRGGEGALQKAMNLAMQGSRTMPALQAATAAESLGRAGARYAAGVAGGTPYAAGRDLIFTVLDQLMGNPAAAAKYGQDVNEQMARMLMERRLPQQQQILGDIERGMERSVGEAAAGLMGRRAGSAAAGVAGGMAGPEILAPWATGLLGGS